MVEYTHVNAIPLSETNNCFDDDNHCREEECRDNDKDWNIQKRKKNHRRLKGKFLDKQILFTVTVIVSLFLVFSFWKQHFSEINHSNQNNVPQDQSISPNRNLLQKQVTILSCRISKDNTRFDNIFEAWEGEETLCTPIDIQSGEESDKSYKITLDKDSLTNFDSLIDLGKLYITIKGDFVVSDEFAEIYLGENISLQRIDNDNIVPVRQRRQLIQERKVGERTALVLRVSTIDSSPTDDADVFYHRVFGYEKVTLQSQFKKCSSGQLTFEPVLGGVIDVTIDKAIGDYETTLQVTMAAQEALKEKLGMHPVEKVYHLADHILFCLPPGLGSWVASAVTNHWRSTYNDINCGRISVLMHEMGHNLGLPHANENGKYLDHTGYMGASQPHIGRPKKCFNGYNHWMLGWFQDRALKLHSFTRPRLIQLASFVDYTITSEMEFVVLNVADEYFIQYNRAKYFNAETGEKRNQVTIVHSIQGNTELIAGLDLRLSTHHIGNFLGSSTSLVIKVCDMIHGSRNNNDPDIAILSIALDESICEYADDYFDNQERNHNDDDNNNNNSVSNNQDQAQQLANQLINNNGNEPLQSPSPQEDSPPPEQPRNPVQEIPPLRPPSPPPLEPRPVPIIQPQSQSTTRPPPPRPFPINVPRPQPQNQVFNTPPRPPPPPTPRPRTMTPTKSLVPSTIPSLLPSFTPSLSPSSFPSIEPSSSLSNKPTSIPSSLAPPKVQQQQDFDTSFYKDDFSILVSTSETQEQNNHHDTNLVSKSNIDNEQLALYARNKMGLFARASFDFLSAQHEEEQLPN